MRVFSKCLWTVLLIADLQVMAQGEKQTLQSSILGETRELLVYTPGKVSANLPLIIVFDGAGLFNATVAATRFMNYFAEMPQMPEACVVGVQNTDRNRDMPIPGQYGDKKGEDNFLRFVRDELIPWMNKKYTLNGHSILVGHSQGGYFVTYLLGRFPQSFAWIVALDAPMNVDPKAISVKESVAKAVQDPTNKIRYASIDAAYGWGNEWSTYFPGNDQVRTEKLTGESHETMAFRGVYAGLQFLYRDFAPVRKDMNLADLKEHYQFISVKYGFEYEIPLTVLTASASRKLAENRKSEILELLDYAEARHGPNEIITQLRMQASKIRANPGSVIDSLLALPRPNLSQLQKYLGKWKGQFITKEGKSFDYSIEISMMNGKPKVLFPPDPNTQEKKEEPEILYVTQEGKLVFGMRNRGGGVIINTFTLDNKGEMAGEGWWLGFTIPDDVPPDTRKQLNFLLTTPTRFHLVKQ